MQCRSIEGSSSLPDIYHGVEKSRDLIRIELVEVVSLPINITSALYVFVVNSGPEKKKVRSNMKSMHRLTSEQYG